jgi:hypothetical protein
MTDPRELATHLDAVADLHDGQDGSPITRDLLRDAAAALRAAVVPATVGGDRSEIDRMIARLRTGRWAGSGGAMFANEVADKLFSLAESEHALSCAVPAAAPAEPWQPPDPNSDAAIPLHELHADAAYLAHRVHQGSMSPDELAAVIRAKIDAFMAPPVFAPEGQP